MTTTTYEERRDQLAINASLLVQVMLGDALGDVEFVVMPATEERQAELRRSWGARGLRHVGFIGLVDGAPQLVSKELLDAVQVQALAVAFGVFVGILVKSAIGGGYVAAEIERAEISELDRLFSLPDTRYVN